MDVLQSIGLLVRSLVLDLAGTLREDYAPGAISLALVLLLAVAMTLFALEVRSRVGALRWLDRKVRRHQDDREFSAALDRLNAEISTAGHGGARAAVAGTWREFAETLIVQDEGGVPVYHNSVRPSAFFNLDDLGFGGGFWRHVPGLFVSVGLFLTFLGLVSALNAMVAESGGNIGPKQMNDLLSVASAKFIMSLTGLLCSIIFTIALRVGLHDAESAAHRLANGIEARLVFLSLEALAAKQLLAVTEQREFLRTLGHELVADLGRPLRDMPGLISRGIEQSMRPLLDQVGRAGTDGLGAMVQDLSSRMTDDVGRALGKASDSIAEAGDRIARLSDRMDQSSSKVGDELNAALTRVSEAVAGIRDTLGEAARDTGGTFNAGAERLLGVMNQTLETIRDNASVGAEALGAAAIGLRDASDGFGRQIESAGRMGAEAASREVGRITADAAAMAASQMLGPLDAIAEKLDAVTRQLADAGHDMRLFADGVKSGGDASMLAASAMRGASQDLNAATAPIRSSIGSVETSISALADATQNVAATVTRTAESTAKSAADVLASAQAILGSERQAIDTALGGISVAIERLREQGARIDDIDGRLGRAFEIYTQQLPGAVDGVHQPVQELQQTRQPAIDTLEATVEEADQPIPKPQSR